MNKPDEFDELCEICGHRLGDHYYVGNTCPNQKDSFKPSGRYHVPWVIQVNEPFTAAPGVKCTIEVGNEPPPAGTHVASFDIDPPIVIKGDDLDD